MLAPLSAGLTTAVFGPSKFPLLVLLTTVNVTWLPMSFVGPKHLSPLTIPVPSFPSVPKPENLNNGAPFTRLASPPVTTGHTTHDPLTEPTSCPTARTPVLALSYLSLTLEEVRTFLFVHKINDLGKTPT